MSESAAGEPDLLATIRAGLIAAEFTSDGVLGRLGPTAYAALAAGVTLPARRELQPHQDLLSLLIRVFLVAEPVAAQAWEVLPAGRELLDDLVDAGLVGVADGVVAAKLAVHPFAGALPAGFADPAPADLGARAPADHRGPLRPSTDWYLVSDVGTPVSPDHVLGLGGAGVTLARITPRTLVGRTLDLGCGSGVQSVQAAVHSAVVVATDTNPRALAMTALSARLSGLPAEQLELRAGSLFDPVAGERFDLIVSNPPFVISPGHRFTYRDAGLPGDELSRQVVRGAAAHLAPGGMAAVLVNWLVIDGEDWRDRVSGWVTEPDVSAWVVSREVTSVLDYALIWLRDAGLRPAGSSGSAPPSSGNAETDFDAALGLWLDTFADQGASAVGFGWVVLVREPPGATPWLVTDDLGSAGRLPDDAEVAGLLAGWSRVSGLSVPDLLALPLQLGSGVVVHTQQLHVPGAGPLAGPAHLGLPGHIDADGWRPPVAVPVPVLAALQADATSPIGQRLDEVAAQMGLDEAELLAVALISLRELLALGLVVS
jgi:SAM-dependent methyltransferase